MGPRIFLFDGVGCCLALRGHWGGNPMAIYPGMLDPPPVFRPWPTHLSGEWCGVGFPRPWEETGDGTRPVMNSSPIWYPVDRGQVGKNSFPPIYVRAVFGPSEPWEPAGGRE